VNILKGILGTVRCRAMRQTLVKLSSLALNIILFSISIYILLFIKPVNLVALMSAVLCPIAMTFRYRGIKFGRWLCALNGFYLSVFYSVSLFLPFIARLSSVNSSQHLFVAFLGTASSFSLLVHSFIFDKAEGTSTPKAKI